VSEQGAHLPVPGDWLQGLGPARCSGWQVPDVCTWREAPNNGLGDGVRGGGIRGLVAFVALVTRHTHIIARKEVVDWPIWTI